MLFRNLRKQVNQEQANTENSYEERIGLRVGASEGGVEEDNVDGR